MLGLNKNKYKKSKRSKQSSRLSRLSPSKLRLGIFMLGFAVLGTFLLFQALAGTHDSGREIDVVNRTNSHRASHGTAALNRSKCLTLAAREWAKYMGDTGTWRHQTEAEWKEKVQRLCGNSNVYGGENLAQGQTTPEEAMQAWLNSADHHRNIDDAKFNHIGAASYRADNGVTWWVQIFAECRGCGGEWTAPVPETGGNTSGGTGTIQGIEFGGDHILSAEREGTGQKTFINANSDGTYAFNNLTVPGTYIVRINGVSGYNVKWTACGNRVGDCHNSPDASGTGTEAKVYFGGAGFIDLWWQFTPVNTTGTILGRVFIDANSNGVWESNEQIVQNGVNCGSYPTLSASINISGYGTAYPNKCNPTPFYEASVSQGSHTVSVSPPSGYTATTGQQTVTVNAGGQNHLWFGIKQNTVSTPPASLPASDGSGLNGYYYNTWYTNPTLLTRIDGPIDFNWGSGSPGGSVPADTFVAAWYGYVKAPYAGTYYFDLASDDASAVYVNGQSVNNFFSDHGWIQQNGTTGVTMSAGQRLPIKVVYYEKYGGAAMQLKWRGPNIGSSTIIPRGYLYPLNSNAGLTASIWNNVSFYGAPSLTRTDQHTYFGWGTGSPAAGINADNFSVRWSGKLTAPGTGWYTFSLDSDDGSRLYLGGSLLIDYWGDHGSGSPKSAAKYLTVGQPIDIRIDQYERGGGAMMYLQWSGPGVASPHWIDPQYLTH